MGCLFMWCIYFAVCGGQRRLYSFLFGKNIQAQIHDVFLNQPFLAHPTLSNEKV